MLCSVNGGVSFDTSALYTHIAGVNTLGGSWNNIGTVNDTRATIAGNVGNVSPLETGVSGHISIPNLASTRPTMQLHTSVVNSSGQLADRVGSIRYGAAGMNAVRFSFASGNIASGTFILESWKE
jgi:hypothetical protein